MEEQTQEAISRRGSAVEPVRTRWSPKPEQILILESIFNSGMVNPPKDETVKIRKLLENFGPVGDANVFYWFQNRRSRSRRRQRQMQAAMAGTTRSGGAGISHQILSSSASSSSPPSTSFFSSGFASHSETAASVEATSSSSGLLPGGGEGLLYPISRLMGIPESVDQGPIYSPPCASSSHCQAGTVTTGDAGFMTVFINGIPQEVPRGPIDLGAIFGQDVLLVHSSGELVPMTDLGILLQGLHAGESYFLVPRHA